MVSVDEKLVALKALDRALSTAIADAASLDAERDNRIALIIYFLETARMEISDILRDASRAGDRTT